MIAKVQFSSLRILLIIQRQSTLVDAKRVLLVKVDALKNVADELMKTVGTQKFSWCRERMSVAELD